MRPATEVLTRCCALWLSQLAFAAVATAASSSLPENLALKALVTADSEHSAQYLARFAVDGQVPAVGSHADSGKAWCVKGATHRNGATLRLEWPDEVTVVEIIYYGRTGWFAEECWKDYGVCLNGTPQPVAKGQLQMGHGPQRIKLAAPAKARSVTLKFTSSYGGLNPGVSEIQVFAVSPLDNALPKFVKLQRGATRPVVDESEQVKPSPELAAKVKVGRLGFEKLLVIKRRELNPSHGYTYHVEGFAAGGGLCIHDVRTSETKTLVASPEGQILDCDLSYDGREILFSWRKKKTEGYHLFVINADGSGLRQITDGPWHDYNACWLPDGGIAFLSTRESRFAYCWISPVGVLHRMERNGSRVQRLSANIANDFTPSVLPDGRVIYSRWEYVDKPAIPVQSLWTIHPDGTGLAGYFGNRVLSPATFMEARAIPGSDKVLCVLTSHNGPCRGALGIIDRSRGVNAQTAIENITPWLRIGAVDKGSGNDVRGPYESPFPLNDELFLVSRRGTVLARDYAGTRMAEIIVAGKDGLGFYSARPLRPQVRPPVLNSMLPIVQSGGWATVVLQDVYNGLEPHVRRGDVKQICVVQEMKKEVRTDVKNRAFGFQFPVISCGATYAAKTAWGFAPVAADGSACFQVPAGIPIYFMALDEHGRALQRMRTFTHLMPGETQGCLGCHDHRLSVAPPKLAAAVKAAPAKLETPEWGCVGFDYSTVVQPVLDRHCVRCHNGPTPPNKVDLTGDKTDFFNVSYESLARGRKRLGSEGEFDNPYTNWIPTYNGMESNILEITPLAWGSPRSKLADLLLAGHPDADSNPRVQLSEEERRRIFTWIDLNVPYYGTAETSHPDVKGCRRMYPPALDAMLSSVAARRCASCHANGVPREVWTRIENPQKNNFLMAPLSRSAGGSEVCGKAVFQNTGDADYQAILKTFEPLTQAMKEKPRIDMPGGAPDPNVDRCRLGKVD
ncbi:MAG: hypothetical protein WCV00_17735 [Verrucomicrobiia bacterium]|jgi:hypothetical protein